MVRYIAFNRRLVADLHCLGWSIRNYHVNYWPALLLDFLNKKQILYTFKRMDICTSTKPRVTNYQYLLNCCLLVETISCNFFITCKKMHIFPTSVQNGVASQFNIPLLVYFTYILPFSLKLDIHASNLFNNLTMQITCIAQVFFCTFMQIIYLISRYRLG